MSYAETLGIVFEIGNNRQNPEEEEEKLYLCTQHEKLFSSIDGSVIIIINKCVTFAYKCMTKNGHFWI